MDRIVLVGLRFGAILATVVAADRTDVAGLVLLAPVQREHSYIRQLCTMEGGPAVDGSIDAGRVQLSTDTVQAINRIELRRVHRATSRVSKLRCSHQVWLLLIVGPSGREPGSMSPAGTSPA